MPLVWPPSLQRKVHPIHLPWMTPAAQLKKLQADLVRWRRDPAAEKHWSAYLQGRGTQARELFLAEEVDVARKFPRLDLLVQYWAAVAGPAFATRALAECWVRNGQHGNGLLTSWQARGAPPQEDHLNTPLSPWLALRRILAATTEFAEARESALQLRPQASLPLRTMLAVAFPRENWAEEDAVTYLAQAHAQGEAPDYGLFLLLSLKDPALSLGLMLASSRKALGFPPCWTYTIVALLREQSVGSLQRMLAMSMGDPRRARVVAEALSVIVTRSAAMVFAEHLNHPDRLVRRSAWQYLKKWPDLARQVCHHQDFLNVLGQ